MAKKKIKQGKNLKAKADNEIDELVAKAQVALQKYMNLSK